MCGMGQRVVTASGRFLTWGAVEHHSSHLSEAGSKVKVRVQCRLVWAENRLEGLDLFSELVGSSGSSGGPLTFEKNDSVLVSPTHGRRVSIPVSTNQILVTM